MTSKWMQPVLKPRLCNPTSHYLYEITWKVFVTGKLVDSLVICKVSVDLNNQVLLKFILSEWKVTWRNETLCGSKNTGSHIKLPFSEF